MLAGKHPHYAYRDHLLSKPTHATRFRIFILQAEMRLHDTVTRPILRAPLDGPAAMKHAHNMFIHKVTVALRPMPDIACGFAMR